MAWRFASADVNYRVSGHQQIASEASTGRQAEWIAFTAGQGTYLHISQAIEHSRVVSDLQIGLSLKSTRPGLQLLARVVLPATLDERTGEPLFALLRGSSYTQPGFWQTLRLENFPQLLERQMRVLRAQHGPKIESRGAYVDYVGVNVYAGQGETQVWLDEVQVIGAVPRDAVPETKTSVATATRTISAATQVVRLSGSLLNVDGRPMFPRVIEYQGEPLSFLAGLGFNAVRTRDVPSDALLVEAEQTGMWLVSPAPPLEHQINDNTPEAPDVIPPKFDRVLVWSLGDGLTEREFERVAAQAASLKRADRRRGRPFLCGAETDVLRYSREVRDVLSFYRFPLSTTLEMADYGTWLRERPQLARAGTPFWTVIQTQPPAATRAQWKALGATGDNATDSDALRLLAYTAFGSGARGLEFASHSRLDVSDDETRTRALALAVLNTELALLEPWGAAGVYVAAADSNDPRVKGVLFQYESSRLLLVTRTGPRAQYVPEHAASSAVSFVLPGVPESHELAELSAAGLRPLKHKRVTGGTLITLDDFNLVSLVLITPETLMANTLSRRLAEIAQRSANSETELAALTLSQVQSVERDLPVELRDSSSGAGAMQSALQSLDAARKAAAAGDRHAAYVLAKRASAILSRLKRKYWERAAATMSSPAASPLLASLSTLPEHWRFVGMLRASSVENNRLPAGEFESLESLVSAGWRHVAHPLKGIDSSVEIAPGGTANGRSCLRIEVRPKELDGKTLLETAPVWISSPSVPVHRGEVLRIAGRVSVASPIRGSVDGLMIVDSLGGEGLAERVGQTQGWQDFVLYRAAPEDGVVTVTFALTGFGEAMVDDVTICQLRTSAGASPSLQRRDSNDAPSAPRIDQAQRTRQIFAPPRR